MIPLNWTQQAAIIVYNIIKTEHVTQLANSQKQGEYIIQYLSN